MSRLDNKGPVFPAENVRELLFDLADLNGRAEWDSFPLAFLIVPAEDDPSVPVVALGMGLAVDGDPIRAFATFAVTVSRKRRVERND